MTDSDVYAFIKNKVQESIEEDMEAEESRINELNEIERTYRFLEEFYKKHNEEIRSYRLLKENDLWLMGAGDSLWRLEHYWKTRPKYSTELSQNEWINNYVDGHHLTAPITFKEIGDAIGCDPKQVKKFIDSLEKDGLIGRVKTNGFYPYRYYIK